MLILGIFGGICLVLGAVFMMDKKDLKKMEAFLNKPVTGSGDVMKYSKSLGIVLLVLAAILFYLGWTMKR
ncbi:MAG: hypothetical protein NTY47_08360 [Candidatus Omnitrophica bacterium]|nr:hypothetical protein [Candidatus Omnitrophota bacterium]